ncbi:MAG: SAM-dependent methyltransferase [Alphaproteobacteria bacterium]|nr:SAM-dependent methyltransferase [Alphaproteobacteria bacterium]
MLTLTDRLQALAARVLPGRPLVDVGTDHGWLPIHLVHQGVVPCAVAVDRRQGPLTSARAHATQAGLDHDLRLALRQGNGLSVVIPDDLDPRGTIVIAGMGGGRIADLLRARPSVLDAAGRLVLQPNTDGPALRRTLGTLGFALVDEALVAEHGQTFLVLVAEPGEQTLTEAEAELGPVLLRDRPRAFLLWLDEEAARLQQVLATAAGSAAEPALRSRLALVDAARRGPGPG